MDREARPLDRIDRRILDILQREGRITNAALSRRVHLSPTPCLERVRRLEREGWITGYVALLDGDRLGAALTVFVEVQLDRTTPDVFETFKAAAAARPEVQECHMIAGGFDYLLKIRVPDMAAYRRFLGEGLTGLPGVRATHTYVAMETVKATTCIAIDAE